ncbi:hypothetical protein FQA39_LY10288 [Lamprigera yunnana]|nr:hypothetical protein FQA39_LY10288 [Lamprigera yunnana]
MPFTSEQVRFIAMVHFRNGTLNPDGNWSYSLQSCIEQFMQQYPDKMIEYDIFKQHKCRLVHRFETKNCICKEKLTGRPTVLTENVIENIQERINRSPKKAVSQLSQQTGLSVGTCFKALKKNLHMHPYKVTVIQRLYPHSIPNTNCRQQKKNTKEFKIKMAMSMGSQEEIFIYEVNELYNISSNRYLRVII